jgi:uncharacterized protein (UPF0276 family)
MDIDQIPTLGVGINYNSRLAERILNNLSKFDFIEVISERLTTARDDTRLEELLEASPMALHGVDLSLGACEPLDSRVVERLAEVCARYKPHWISEHIAFCRASEYDIGQLMPIRHSAENVKVIADKVLHLKERLNIPFLLENITYYFSIPDAEMSESEFISEILETADCGMLLDLNNLYINSVNHGFDPYMFLDNIPLHRVVEVHLSGGEYMDGVYVDNHGHGVVNEVFELLEHVCSRTDVKAIVLERDRNFADFNEILDNAATARRILESSTANGHADQAVVRPDLVTKTGLPRGRSLP